MKIILTFFLIFLFQLLDQSAAQQNKNFYSIHKNNKISGIELLLKSTDYLFVDSAWQENSRITYNYVPVSLLLESKLYEVINAGDWENETLHKYYYETSFQPYEELVQDWSGSGWENHWKYSYTYNELFQIETLLLQYYSFGDWKNNDSANFSYNSIDSLDYLYQFRWDVENWVNTSWTSYAYDVGGLLEELIIKSWNEDSTNWKNEFRFTFVYNHEYNLSEKIYELWVDSNWVKQTKTEFIYNNGLLTERYLYEWDGNDWVESKKYTYMYDYFYLLNELTEFNWNGSEWANYKQTIYDRVIVSVGDESEPVQDFKLLQNYPNPFNPATTITYTLPSTQFTTLRIYNSLGELVQTLVNEEQPAGEYEVEFDGSKLSSGIYFYQIGSGEYVETKKMILIK